MQDINPSTETTRRPAISLPPISILGSRPLPLPEPSPKPKIVATEEQRALIMVGLDDNAKPHASWFSLSDAVRVATAADLMDMALIEVKTPDLVAIAAALPRGSFSTVAGRSFPSSSARLTRSSQHIWTTTSSPRRQPALRRPHPAEVVPPVMPKPARAKRPLGCLKIGRN